MHLCERIHRAPGLALGPAAKSASLNLFIQANIQRRNWVNAVATWNTSASEPGVVASVDGDEPSEDPPIVRCRPLSPVYHDHVQASFRILHTHSVIQAVILHLSVTSSVGSSGAI